MQRSSHGALTVEVANNSFDDIKQLATYVTCITMSYNEFTNKFVNISTWNGEDFSP